jgi:hypothetical protein
MVQRDLGTVPYQSTPHAFAFNRGYFFTSMFEALRVFELLKSIYAVLDKILGRIFMLGWARLSIKIAVLQHDVSVSWGALGPKPVPGWTLTESNIQPLKKSIKRLPCRGYSRPSW